MSKLQAMVTVIAGMVLALLANSAAYAQGAPFPNKPIQIVVTFPAGGSADFVGRVIAEHLSKSLGQQVVVLNRAGAAGSLGAQSVATAQPDGYTLVLTSVGALVINPAITHKKPYNTLRDFAPISVVAKVFEATMASKASGLQSFRQLIDTAKSSSNTLSFGSTGVGSLPHLFGELLKMEAGINLVHVPYTGGAPAISDLLAGRIELLIADLPAYLPLITAGSVVALSINSDQRTKAAPTIPTTVEQGYPHLIGDNWFGLLAPAGTPEPVVTRLNQAVVAALNDPAVIENFARGGAVPVAQSPAEFRQYISQEETRWGEVIARAKLSID